MFRRTNDRKKRGYVRETEDKSSTTTTYAPTPSSRRRVNSKVNSRFGRVPEGWYSEDCEG